MVTGGENNSTDSDDHSGKGFEKFASLRASPDAVLLTDDLRMLAHLLDHSMDSGTNSTCWCAPMTVARFSFADGKEGKKVRIRMRDFGERTTSRGSYLRP